MSKSRSSTRFNREMKNSMARKDLSFCFEVEFLPPASVRFSQIETPHSVVIDLCPDHAGKFLWDVGDVFTQLPTSKRQSFDNCILLFADHLLKNPQEHTQYQLSKSADNYLSYLQEVKQADDQEADSFAPLDEKSTRH
jgi:hypothetical protein